MSDNMLMLWGIFIALFFIVFFIDMYVTDHTKGPIKIKSSMMWTSIWIMTAMAYSVLIYHLLGETKIDGKTISSWDATFQFIQGYIAEYSLSVDNLFVFIVVFNKMGIPASNQPRILKWGIIGAIILRVIFILLGVELIQRFDWMIYVFGVLLVVTAFKMLKSDEEDFNPEDNFIIKILSRFMKVKPGHDTDRFFVRENGHLYMTFAFFTLIVLDILDLVFAIDSIPAVLGITQLRFIAITSNLFAVLGLRSLFFALSGLIDLFKYLKYGVIFILFFIGVKMLISRFYHFPQEISLMIIVFSLLSSIVASLILKEAEKLEHPEKVTVKEKELEDFTI